MDSQREKNVRRNDHTRTVAIRCPTTTNLKGYEDLGVNLLENTQSPKRCRYLNPNSTIWPMGYGLVTSLYKYRNKRPIKTTSFNFDWLPEEVILHIFKMLDKHSLTKCAYVCNQFRRIAYDACLWQCLNIPRRRMSVMSLGNLLERNIKFLSISHANIYVDTKYSFETPLTKLKYLDMSAVFIPVENLSSLLSQCRNLVKLSLENCTLNVDCCKSIGLNTNLKVLNLACTHGLNCVGLMHILSLKNLEELNVSWAHMEDVDLHYLGLKIMPSIKRLNVSGFLKKLSDIELILMVCGCPQLIELDISDNLAITSSSVDFILNKQSNLQILSMSRCYNVGSAFLHPSSLRMKIGNTVHGLKELNMFGIGNQQAFNVLCALLFELDINKNLYSSIARPKLADNENTIWEIPICIDC